MTFAVLGARCDINALSSREQGLYHRGTRHLSKLALRIAHQRPVSLHASTRADNQVITSHLANPELAEAGRVLIPAGAVHVARSTRLRESCLFELLEITSYAATPVTLELSWHFAADFADMFEVRGIARLRRGRAEIPEVRSREVRLAYTGLDRERRGTRLLWDPEPTVLDANLAHFVVRLAPREKTTLRLRVACEPEEGVQVASWEQAEATGRRRERCRIRSSNELFDRWIERSVADLEMMVTTLPTGRYPFAGLPWFTTVFGRDGLLTALQALWIDPSLARGTLRTLAQHQAERMDPKRDAEPGKILHELRDGEMAALGEVPFGRYYGAVDTTPLFILLAHATWQTTGDVDLIEDLWPHIVRALRWMEEHGDRDGDGFLEYRRSREGLVNQGWKDSPETISHADGSYAHGDIALCEVQGYAYAALRAAADLARVLGEVQLPGALGRQADILRYRFEKTFWDDALGSYVLALDGDKRPCRVRTSNAGQVLLSGIAKPEHARAQARTLFTPELFSGWGIRTLSADDPLYNPMSYHNGSIWPHDCALIARGLATYGLTVEATRLLTALFEASSHFELHRLPELFCGFDRQPDMGATPYPSACAPQAWAAASVFQLLASSLGLQIDAPRHRVVFRHPQLPPFLEELEITDLALGETRLDLHIYRHRDRVGVNVSRMDGPGEVVVVP